MAYSTPALVRQALSRDSDGSEITDPALFTHTAADLSDDQIVGQIARADATIDGYLSGVYITPVAPIDALVPEPIQTLSVDIAQYFCSLSYFQNEPVLANAPTQLRYNAAMSFLTQVGNGSLKIDIPPDDGGDGSASVVALAAVNPYQGTLFGPGAYDGLELSGSAWPNARPLPYDGRW